MFCAEGISLKVTFAEILAWFPASASWWRRGQNSENVDSDFSQEEINYRYFKGYVLGVKEKFR